MTEPAPPSARPGPELQAPELSVERGHAPPSRAARLRAVVARHWIVYRSTLIANSLPAFLEPLLFLSAVGLGLGGYLADGMGGLPLGAFMGPGALAMTAMFTSSFETTYGSFVRRAYQKTYDGMLATPLSPEDVFLGELLWCGVKGFLFTAVVLCVLLGFGRANGWWGHFLPTACAIPLVGFCCAFLFGALGLHVSARVHNMNNFSFYFTGVLTPLSLFSGMVFPVADLPAGLRQLAYALPLFHVTELNRLLLFGAAKASPLVWASPLYLLVACALAGWTGVRAARERIVV